MTNRLTSDTAAWSFQTWAAFLISTTSTGIGIFILNIDLWPKMFLGLGMFFTVSSCFALSKMVRDRHESDKLVNKLDEAKTEQVLRDYVREAA